MVLWWHRPGEGVRRGEMKEQEQVRRVYWRELEQEMEVEVRSMEKVQV